MSDVASIRVPLCIAASHPCLSGHFPGQPVVPGVVILDAVQQAIEVKAGALPPLRLPQVKFVQPLLPGESAEIVAYSTAPGRWRFRVVRGDSLLASGEMVVT